MRSIRDALRRRLEATRRVWRPGSAAHMRLLEPGPRPPLGHCGGIDVPRAGSLLARSATMFSGWARLPSGPASRVELHLGDVPLGTARLGMPRPDVSDITGEAADVIAGWELLVDLERVPVSGRAVLHGRVFGVGGEEGELAGVPVRLAPRRADVAPVTRPPLPPRRAARAGAPPLRLLVFTHRLDLGGGQLYLLDLLRGLHRIGGFEMAVVTEADGPLRARLERLGVSVHVTSVVPFHDPRVLDGRVEELAAWAGPGRWDVVLCNTAIEFVGVEVAARLGCPAVFAIHESYVPSALWWHHRPVIHPAVERRAVEALGRCAAAVFEADATRRQYEPFVGAGRSHTLPYGLDLRRLAATRARFDRAAARARRDVPQEAKVVLCVGTVEPRKGQVPLLQAFGLIAAEHPDARLVLIGARHDPVSGVLREYREAGPWAGQVEILPVIGDVWSWYGLADLLVCASDVESLPRSVLEAMAWELPVLATSVFGLAELIDPGRTGWLCEPRDVRALAGALDSTLRLGDAERRAVAVAARQDVEARHALIPYARACAELFRAAVDEATAARVHPPDARGPGG